MNIRIVSFRKKDDRSIRVVEDEYLKRLEKYARVELIDKKNEKVRERKVSSLSQSGVKKGEYVVVLSERGKEYSSKEFAGCMKRLLNEGHRIVTFVIGSPEGTEGAIETEADMLLSLSRMTYPHRIARLLLIEALYRSFEMIHNGPYHKE